jgi:hypothetical protein
METREDLPPARLTPEMSEAACTLNVVSPVLGTEAGRQEGPTEHCGLPLDVALEAPTGVEDTAPVAELEGNRRRGEIVVTLGFW